MSQNCEEYTRAAMVHCIIFGCSSNSGKEKGIGYYRIPKFVTREGEQAEELRRERRERWISAISRNDLKWKNVLESERVCGRHFVSGQPAQSWDRHSIGWVPTLNLGKKEYTTVDHKAVEARVLRTKERAEKRRQLQLQELEMEVAAKRKQIGESGLQVSNIDFEHQPGACTSGDNLEMEHIEFQSFNEDENQRDASTQTKDCVQNNQTHTNQSKSDIESQTDEFQYMFCTNVYKQPDQDYFDSDDKARFYTGLPSTDTLLTVLRHVEPYVRKRIVLLNNFQQLCIVLMKLRLNVPLQDLAYRFNISKTTVSRIIVDWLTVIDIRLTPLIA